MYPTRRRPVKPQYARPEAVTPRQAQALDAYIRYGSQKRAAETMGITLRTLECHLCNAQKRMGIYLRVHMIVEWTVHRIEWYAEPAEEQVRSEQ